MRVQEKGESEAGRRERACHTAHGIHHVLAPERDTHVGTAVHGTALWQAAGILQERSRATCSVECARYTEDAFEGTRREGVWPRTTDRDAKNHRRREERSVRRPRLRGLRSAAAHTRRTRWSGKDGNQYALQ